MQGVGFRPFVYRVAVDAGLTGRVLNDSVGVFLEVQGPEHALRRFADTLARELPPLARIESQQRCEVPVVPGENQFLIDESPARRPGMDGGVTVDTAVCPECLAEMRDPADRRNGHGLINCTNCGPRFSIIGDIPYDRPNTTMRAFEMCADCRREYLDPADRRFHAQPVCCPACGPRVGLVTFRDEKIRRAAADRSPTRRVRRVRSDPYVAAAELLDGGKIVAIKGIGGFHLAVRADLQQAVARLRHLKKRDAKPFALMVRDLAMARRLVSLSAAGESALISHRAPVVLAPRQTDADACVAAGVAPGTDLLGVMLPYTPIQHLLWDALARLWSRAGREPYALVMTSGNRSSEPLVIDNREALARLGRDDRGLCDAILWHDRPIERCVDDSVVLDIGPLPQESVPAAGATVMIRRSRGDVPGAWMWPAALAGEDFPTGICVGGELKNTVAVVRQRDVIVSQHLGDLSDALAFEHFGKALDDLIRLFAVRVEFVAHDLHPGYMSTLAARRLAARHAVRLIGVQHHVAHAAGVLAENGKWDPQGSGPAGLAIVCDGTGYGDDGTIWGGELLALRAGRFKRLGRLRPMRLPGGDAAALDPRRSALALLATVRQDDFEDSAAAGRLFPRQDVRRVLSRMIRAGINSPLTSSTGRLFDAVAALLSVCHTNDHEAQAPMALESAARRAMRVPAAPGDPGELFAVARQGDLWELDIRPLVQWILDGVERGEDAGRMAWEFHRQLAQGWIAMVEAVDREGHWQWDESREVGASGGTFCNRLLIEQMRIAGAKKNIRTFFHKSYPPTDGGLAFGQAVLSRTR